MKIGRLFVAMLSVSSRSIPRNRRTLGPTTIPFVRLPVAPGTRATPSADDPLRKRHRCDGGCAVFFSGVQTPPVVSGAPGVLPLIEFAPAPPVATEDGEPDACPVDRDLMDASNSNPRGGPHSTISRVWSPSVGEGVDEGEAGEIVDVGMLMKAWMTSEWMEVTLLMMVASMMLIRFLVHSVIVGVIQMSLMHERAQDAFVDQTQGCKTFR